MRLDNPRHYLTWYYGQTPEVAIGESFGDHEKWSDEMFEVKYLTAGRKVLGVFELPDDIALLDMDDARTLLDRFLRPTQVVSRVRPVTQGWALRVYQEQREHDGARRWDGVRWWSYHRPQWEVFGVWAGFGDPVPHRLVRIEHLSRNHPAVESARGTLDKPWH